MKHITKYCPKFTENIKAPSHYPRYRKKPYYTNQYNSKYNIDRNLLVPFDALQTLANAAENAAALAKTQFCAHSFLCFAFHNLKFQPFGEISILEIVACN